MSDHPSSREDSTMDASREAQLKVKILAPCGHELKLSVCVGTPSAQNLWKCTVCGKKYLR